MSYRTRTPSGGPTVWKEPEDCVDEWARVKEVRGDKDLGGHANKVPTHPRGLPTGRKGISMNAS